MENRTVEYINISKYLLKINKVLSKSQCLIQSKTTLKTKTPPQLCPQQNSLQSTLRLDVTGERIYYQYSKVDE